MPYIIIAGPTAAGKSAAAVELARLIGGEVISADSMQVYRGMDIGTAKITKEEMKGVAHYLIDELDPDCGYSVYEFVKRAEKYAAKIREKGKHPIICGGTGFYISALVRGTEFEGAVKDENYRNELYSFAESAGAEALHGRLVAVDPAAAAEIHPNNVKRTVRALEYFRLTGAKISEHNRKERKRTQRNAFVNILTAERPILYERINSRVEKMFKEGLIDEVRGLLRQGYSPELTSMQGIGYKETIKHLNGEYSLDFATEAVKAATRQYAKRQLTWFSRQIEGEWYDADKFSSARELAERIWEHYAEQTGKLYT